MLCRPTVQQDAHTKVDRLDRGRDGEWLLRDGKGEQASLETLPAVFMKTASTRPGPSQPGLLLPVVPGTAMMGRGRFESMTCWSRVSDARSGTKDPQTNGLIPLWPTVKGN